MNCIKKIYNTQTEVKKSKFLSYLVPFSEFAKLHQKLKQEHPKANHIIYAYRYINEHNQVIENSSDDGEPKGSAGMPTLNHLRGANLVECAILTVRYFGGIKLGIGGMVRAYSASAKEVINSAKVIPYEKLFEFKIQKPYSQQRQFEYFLKELNITPTKREFLQDKVEWTLNISQKKIELIKNLINSSSKS